MEIQTNTFKQESKWTGGVLEYFGIRLAVFFLFILSAFTLFLVVPWIIVFYIKWQTKHTVINGKKLAFNGTGAQLFGSYIKWWLLSIVTLGIYGFFFTPVRKMQWIVKHTVFAE